MEFRDLKQQYIYNKDNIDSAILKTVAAGTFIGGEQVSKLEEELAEYVGVKHCVSCANGTDALQLALMTWGVGTGDAVFVPDFTFFSTAEVVSALGATPIFVNVRKDTFNIDVDDLEQAIECVVQEGVLEPKVVISVDLFGQPAEYSRIREILKKYKLFLLEDGAQGFGGQIGEEKACSFGDISTTSFFPAKPLGCYGDGGAIFTNDDEWASILKSLKVHGKGSDKYDNVRIGMNSRLDTIQAAVLREKLKVFRDYEIQKCNDVASMYSNMLKDYVEVPIVLNDMLSSWAQYTIRLQNKEERNRVLNGLKEAGIPAFVYYEKPLHLQTAFADLNVLRQDKIHTQQLCDTVLSLPMHPYLSNDDIELVVEVVRKCVKQ